MRFNLKDKNFEDIYLSIVFALVGMFLFIGNGISWETHDDHYIAELLATRDNVFSLFQPKWFSYIFAYLYANISSVEWWAIGQIVTNFIAIAVILYVFIKKFSRIVWVAVSLITLVVVDLTMIHAMNFTKTSAMAAIAGLIIISYAVDNFEKLSKTSAIHYAIGTLLIIISAAYRFNMALLILPFGTIMVLIKAVETNDKGGFKNLIINIFKVGKYALTCVIIMFLVMAASELMYTTAEQEARAQHAASASVQDYFHRYPSYEQTVQEYQKFDMSMNDFRMLTEWKTKDEDLFTTELFVEMRDTMYDGSIEKQVWNILMDVILQFPQVAFLMFFILFVISNNKTKFKVLPYFIIAIALMSYIAVRGRVVPRVIDPIFLGLFLFSAYIMLDEKLFANRDFLPFIKSNPIKQGEFTIKQLVAKEPRSKVVLLALAMIFAVPTIADSVNNWKVPDNKNYNSSIYAPVYQYMIDNGQDNFLLPIANSHFDNRDACYSIFEPKPTDLFRNLYYIGNWTSYMPYMQTREELAGIDNLFYALTQTDNTVATHDEHTYNWLKEHVDENVKISLVQRFTELDVRLIEYCAPLDINNAKVASSGIKLDLFEFQALSAEHKGSPTTDSFWISGELPAEEMQNYSQLYCHIVEGDEQYTYKVGVDKASSTFASNLYGLGYKFDTKDVEVYILAKTNDGELLNVLTVM